ncbi:MAG: ATP synthase subunit a [Candidatus Nomurabacteria bacterium GW2011_GWF2_35_66]|uniref:ATP synthase subunit a n=1 Tax=Candidatus Nomurabacteria bacterium GW2011_GWE1_35_16 TaxID=1618761 RepID=A0A0G0EEN0_9BACT|nr:MAG: ATP synthase subunit a [Candidatus Nomurabacteria bacterium GW2011_GWF1_34_20]KKP63403.1 MAG: ATP synthase subunit a [Candidatus Nomurabacteria bacterium GW2011_GWE2_34_25]KKP65782.1 MAG: ATP synthase subunit a [Candidatus Nomurabacteria bacterium GW2011_GWE1_35_16]KKP83641.1 MAG: ATP synthase subunit a [Candidatus Nomurabacteria bacterium GW2011_GWF2_35_66]HAE36900.1 ATP synthase F0 subunit A [Candidatus Nomurabacteria bacterium]
MSQINIENQIGEAEAVNTVGTGASEEISHESTLYAEPIGHIGNFTITNSVFTTWIVVLIVLVVTLAIKIKAKKIPKGIQNGFEIIIEGAMNLADQVTGSKKITAKVFPLAFSIFIFVLISNWLGILPLGGFGLIETTEHGKAFIPFIRSGTADINTTLALGIMSVIGANIFGILSIGVWKMFNKYVNVNAFGEMIRKVRKEPAILISAPIMFFVGVLELIGEFAKIASLSFRLFGNVFAGEVLLMSMSAILAYGLPLPFMGLELFVGFIQAFIFSILTLVYFTIAAQDHDEHEEHNEKDKSTHKEQALV